MGVGVDGLVDHDAAVILTEHRPAPDVVRVCAGESVLLLDGHAVGRVAVREDRERGGVGCGVGM